MSSCLLMDLMELDSHTECDSGCRISKLTYSACESVFSAGDEVKIVFCGRQKKDLVKVP